MGRSSCDPKRNLEESHDCGESKRPVKVLESGGEETVFRGRTERALKTLRNCGASGVEDGLGTAIRHRYMNWVTS